MGSQYSPAIIESLPDTELPKVRADIVAELRPFESIIAGMDASSLTHQKAVAEAEYRRMMLAQIHERLLLSTVEKLRGATQSLQSSTIDMAGGVKTLNDSVTSLEKTTTKLLKSSTRIEYLTILVALTTISSIAITLLEINILYSVAVSVAGSIALIRLWQKIRKHPAFQPD